MKKLFIATLSVLALASCSRVQKNADNYEILGSSEKFEGEEVILTCDNDTLAVDTVRNGQFRITGYVDTVRMVVLSVPKKVGYQFFLEPGTLTTVLEDRSEQGTPLNDAYNKYWEDTQGLIREMFAEGEKEGKSARYDSLNEVYTKISKEFRSEHAGDPIGLYLTQRSSDNLTLAKIDSLFNLYELYRNDPYLNKVRANKLVEEGTAPGKPCIDFAGVNATTGESMKLSDIVGQGKLAIVDFWASWCGPCRREINEHLSKIAPQYKDKVNFLGVAVWENSIDDTKKAMSELPISWPIMFAGGREDSPTKQYGIAGIPEIMLIDGDGIILNRDLRGDQIVDAIEKALEQ